MPHRLLKSHVSDNPRLWAGIMAVIAAAAACARTRLGSGYHLGDLAALALMVGAILAILIGRCHAPQPVKGEEHR